MDGIRRFAGDDAERARYYPEDARYLESLAPHVEHFEVLAQGATAPAGTDGAELAHEVETLAEGDPWHGPPLAEVLDGVTAEAASARPLAGAHTIWELVLHITAWNDVMRRRLEGTAVEEPEAGDFPAPPAPTAAAWAQAKDALFAEHRKLAAVVARLSAGDLRRPVPGRSYDTFFQVRSAIRHTVYHTGQIGLLRKATLR
jgi:uncharacterized damage-inducible protein DinB